MAGSFGPTPSSTFNFSQEEQASSSKFSGLTPAGIAGAILSAGSYSAGASLALSSDDECVNTHGEHFYVPKPRGATRFVFALDIMPKQAQPQGDVLSPGFPNAQKSSPGATTADPSDRQPSRCRDGRVDEASTVTKLITSSENDTAHYNMYMVSKKKEKKEPLRPCPSGPPPRGFYPSVSTFLEQGNEYLRVVNDQLIERNAQILTWFMRTAMVAGYSLSRLDIYPDTYNYVYDVAELLKKDGNDEKMTRFFLSQPRSAKHTGTNRRKTWVIKSYLTTICNMDLLRIEYAPVTLYPDESWGFRASSKLVYLLVLFHYSHLLTIHPCSKDGTKAQISVKM